MMPFSIWKAGGKKQSCSSLGERLLQTCRLQLAEIIVARQGKDLLWHWDTNSFLEFTKAAGEESDTNRSAAVLWYVEDIARNIADEAGIHLDASASSSAASFCMCFRAQVLPAMLPWLLQARTLSPMCLWSLPSCRTPKKTSRWQRRWPLR